MSKFNFIQNQCYYPIKINIIRIKIEKMKSLHLFHYTFISLLIF